MSQRNRKQAANVVASVQEETEHDAFVSEILETLETRRPKSENEKTAISVAKILTPIMAQTINKAVEPAIRTNIGIGSSKCCYF